RPPSPPVDPAAQREARKTMARVEKRLTRLGEREDRLHHEMADAAHDHERLAELGAELGELTKERDGLEMEWLEAAEIVGWLMVRRVVAAGGNSHGSSAGAHSCDPAMPGDARRDGANCRTNCSSRTSRGASAAVA